MSEVSFPYPVFVCDTGGTNVRFAAVAAAGAPLGEVVHLKTGDYPGLAEALEAASAKIGVKPRSAIACGAGPVVDGRRLKLTNAPWLMDGPKVAAALGLAQGLLLNDFEAQALSLPTIPEKWAMPIGPGRFDDEHGPQVILGPGTGLGVGALVRSAGRFTPLASEACHTDFGPVGDEEMAIWPHLERVRGRVTTESVMAGPGLARLHRARLLAAGRPAPPIDPADVDTRAHDVPSSEEAKSVALYWRIVARFAGDMGVTFVATGGVTLAGGVLPRLHDLLDERAFRAVFEAKAPVDALARRIPTRLVIQPDSVLLGMAAIAAAPERYAIDYEARCWR
ncbi:MAG TPA: glucokinase [Roseiarcus sp.]|jgi:glucokinase|nr:glucokinase [Roseiarcus sp.]